MIKARASGSKVYLYFMKKGRQARHRIPRISCVKLESAYSNTISDVAMGAASGLSDHDFSFSAVFTHILHLGRSGHRRLVLNPG